MGEREDPGHLVARESYLTITAQVVGCCGVGAPRGRSLRRRARPIRRPARRERPPRRPRDGSRARPRPRPGATFSPPVMIVSPARPVTVRLPSASSAPSSPVCSQPSDDERGRRDRRAGDEDLAAGPDPHARAEERRAAGRDLRAGLGQAVGADRRHAGGGGPLEQRRGDRRAADERGAQVRRVAQAGVEQARERRRHDRHERGARGDLVGGGLGLEALVQDDLRRVDRAAHEDREAADVRQRQRAQPGVVAPDAERRRRAERAPQPVAERQRDRARAARRARRVDDDRRRA